MIPEQPQLNSSQFDGLATHAALQRKDFPTPFLLLL